MDSTVVSAQGTRARAIIGVLAAATLILFGAAPAWAVNYGPVTATAPSTPSCTLAGKTYTCTVSGTGSYAGVNSAPASSVYLQIEVWRCPVTTLSIAANGTAPTGCAREANLQTAPVLANCILVCIPVTKSSGSAACSATSAFNYFTRSTLWLTTGTLAAGTTSLTKNVKGC